MCHVIVIDPIFNLKKLAQTEFEPATFHTMWISTCHIATGLMYDLVEANIYTKLFLSQQFFELCSRDQSSNPVFAVSSGARRVPGVERLTFILKGRGPGVAVFFAKSSRDEVRTSCPKVTTSVKRASVCCEKTDWSA